MAEGLTNSAKLAFLRGEHDAADTYRAALYNSAAGLSAATTAYSAANECVGTGYIAGGQALTGYTATLSGGTAFLDFNDPSWGPGATISDIRQLLIYNDTDPGKPSVSYHDFAAAQAVANGTFTAQMPTPDPTSAIIRLS